MQKSLNRSLQYTIGMAFVVIALALTGLQPSAANASSTLGSFADLAEKLIPTVVNISSRQKVEEVNTMPEMHTFPPGSPFEDFFEDFLDRQGQQAPAMPPASLGSGFVIDAENGYIVTNSHVVRNAEDIRVTFYDDQTVDATLIGHDSKTDIAVLKVDSSIDLSAISYGNSDKMRVGDWVIAIGNPFGLGGTVTAGIISAQQRNINAGPYDDFIQTDASINRGNSGGPMFDTDGNVIGINTAIFSPSGGSVGIGFAVPINLAKPVIDQLIEFGHTRRGWLGVRIQSVSDEIAESLGLDSAHGALVASLSAKGPAEKSGVKAGDIILSFDGKDIDEMRDLPRIVAETKVGSSVDVVIWRGEEEITKKVVLGELEKAEETGLLASESTPDDTPENTPGTKVERVGITIKAIDKQERDIYAIRDSLDGIIISDVEDESEAAEKGLIAGDVISEINQKPVTSVTEFQETLSAAKEAKRSSILLLVHREDNTRFVALGISEEQEQE